VQLSPGRSGQQPADRRCRRTSGGLTVDAQTAAPTGSEIPLCLSRTFAPDRLVRFDVDPGCINQVFLAPWGWHGFESPAGTERCGGPSFCRLLRAAWRSSCRRPILRSPLRDWDSWNASLCAPPL